LALRRVRTKGGLPSPVSPRLITKAPVVVAVHEELGLGFGWADERAGDGGLTRGAP
jgi:hypothetical protein